MDGRSTESICIHGILSNSAECIVRILVTLCTINFCAEFFSINSKYGYIINKVLIYVDINREEESGSRKIITFIYSFFKRQEDQENTFDHHKMVKLINSHVTEELEEIYLSLQLISVRGSTYNI